VPVGEAMLKAVQDAFFGPVRVSVMAESNGSNTTAAAAVLKIIRAVPVAGKRAVILAGTGPVGVRAATLLAKEGCQVVLTSRTMSRARMPAARSTIASTWTLCRSRLETKPRPRAPSTARM